MVTMPWWAYAAVCCAFTLLGTFILREVFDDLWAWYNHKKDKS